MYLAGSASTVLGALAARRRSPRRQGSTSRRRGTRGRQSQTGRSPTTRSARPATTASPVPPSATPRATTRRSCAWPCGRQRWDRVLADAAYDGEENYRLCRRELGVRSTVIPAEPAQPRRHAAAGPLPPADTPAPPTAGLPSVLGGGEHLQSHRRRLGSALHGCSDPSQDRMPPPGADPRRNGCG